MQNKLFLITDNLATGYVPKEKCFIVDQMDYKLQRKIHQNGLTYGPSEASILTMTLRQKEEFREKVFYENLVAKDSHDFTLVFDPTFDDENHLIDYSSVAVMSGYIVEVKENYDCGLMSDNELSDQQMLLTVQILLDHVRYMGATDSANITLYDN